MSNHVNHRRRGRKDKRTEHGSTWEGFPPSSGCNSTHVARGRRWWQDHARRTLRRTGKQSPKFMMHPPRVLPPIED